MNIKPDLLFSTGTSLSASLRCLSELRVTLHWQLSFDCLNWSSYWETTRLCLWTRLKIPFGFMTLISSGSLVQKLIGRRYCHLRWQSLFLEIAEAPLFGSLFLFITQKLVKWDTSYRPAHFWEPDLLRPSYDLCLTKSNCYPASHRAIGRCICLIVLIQNESFRILLILAMKLNQQNKCKEKCISCSYLGEVTLDIITVMPTALF